MPRTTPNPPSPSSPPFATYNVQLIASLPPNALSKPVTHPERGAMTFETIVETMGGHDLNHIAQIEKISSIR